MYSKKTKRLIRDSFARLLFRAWTACVLFIPLHFLRWIGILSGKLFYLFSERYRKLATDNLKLAFPEKNEDELETVIRHSFAYLGESGSDTVWFITRPHRKRNSFVRLAGKELLDKALKRRHGVIAVTAHIGAFTILGGALASYGYQVDCILRTPRDKKMSDILGRGLRTQRVKPIFTSPITRCVDESISALRRNEILIILIDQDIGESGVFINFFGRPASTPVGPLVFSLRTDAAILPMFMIKEYNRHKLIIHPEFKIIYGENTEKTLLDNTQRLTKLVENVIREYPHQWSWVDRRWGTKPR